MSPIAFNRSIFSSSRAAPVDLEAQTSSTTSPAPVTYLSSPARAATHEPHSLPLRSSVNMVGTTNPLDDFFGVTAPSMYRVGNRESRHDSGALLPMTEADLPPPYEILPAYTESRNEEPTTLAKYMFLYGFLFPPFWIIGTLILFLSLSAPAEWHAEKPEMERQELLNIMRRTEVRWAKRCAFALVLLLLVVGVAVGVGFGVMRA
ncbi:hypothetical protein GLOTRDRAFT_45136 [Gloeophyllum trabeum ATCC 11539]|uniref:Uncharacterized protein n=1 Tax=Gloeophyllum trabeum (strain ATCC 11539 / FP-39264 / Madison 617) TaxID=670483 RepID=S7Q1Y9_GLOTA|nr:uncharacterized protein GLOTRDRAFT_45136 [Gloeophyllum trabeum ATCC 11539]EPQ53537.1 hypothetical protein GLOTRDRAFT_45136 [Gloeophyllum trabeum ATCC 11539]